MCRPANRDQLDDNTLAIGVPSYMPSSKKSGRGLYFVSMRAVAAMTSIASTTSSLCETHLRDPPFEGLELGTLLGRGGYGSVYRGSYKDQRCAVKVLPGSLPLPKTIERRIVRIMLDNILSTLPC